MRPSSFLRVSRVALVAAAGEAPGGFARVAELKAEACFLYAVVLQPAPRALFVYQDGHLLNGLVRYVLHLQHERRVHDSTGVGDASVSGGTFALELVYPGDASLRLLRVQC